MKIKLFEDISIIYKDDKIVCLYDFSRDDIDNFILFIHEIINNETIKALDTEPFIIGPTIRLLFKKGSKDIGIKKDTNYYICELRKKTFIEMITLIDDLRNKNFDGFQWLYNLNTPIDFLLSNNCTW